MGKIKILIMLLIWLMQFCTSVIAEERLLILSGKFTPLYGINKSSDPVFIHDFYIDKYPVTNFQFAIFVNSNTNWQPSKINSSLTDSNYLKHWIRNHKNQSKPNELDSKKPVVNVSWFAAHDYCTWKGGRLPTVLEWEYVAAAGEKSPDETKNPAFIQQLLDWYSQPNIGLHEVGKGQPNYWGVYNLHGLVWEWTADFNSVFVVGDNRRDGESLEDLFCGAGAASGTDRANYAAYMRYAMRSSLKGHYTATNIGFRCAYNQGDTK